MTDDSSPWVNPIPNATIVCKQHWPACAKCPIITPCNAPLDGLSSDRAALARYADTIERAALVVLTIG